MLPGRGDGSAGSSSSPAAASWANGCGVSPALTQLVPTQATCARGRKHASEWQRSLKARTSRPSGPAMSVCAGPSMRWTRQSPAAISKVPPPCQLSPEPARTKKTSSSPLCVCAGVERLPGRHLDAAQPDRPGAGRRAEIAPRARDGPDLDLPLRYVVPVDRRRLHRPLLASLPR